MENIFAPITFGLAGKVLNSKGIYIHHALHQPQKGPKKYGLNAFDVVRNVNSTSNNTDYEADK